MSWIACLVSEICTLKISVFPYILIARTQSGLNLHPNIQESFKLETCISNNASQYSVIVTNWIKMLGEYIEGAWFWKAPTSKRWVTWDVCLKHISICTHSKHLYNHILVPKPIWNRPGNETINPIVCCPCTPVSIFITLAT